MIKNILKRKEERDTYPTHTVDIDGAERAQTVSTDMSQVGVALFPSF